MNVCNALQLVLSLFTKLQFKSPSIIKGFCFDNALVYFGLRDSINDADYDKFVFIIL